MSSTYRKTEQGLAEIQTRALRLSPRLRGALIVVDGHRSQDDLRVLIRDFDECIRTLLHHRLVELAPPRKRPRSKPKALPTQRVSITLNEPLDDSLTSQAQVAPAAPSTRRPPAEAEVPQAVTATAWLGLPTQPMPPPEPPKARPDTVLNAEGEPININTFRREAARALMEQTDVEGEVLAAQLLRAREPEELDSLLEVAAELLARKKGRDAAQAYRQRFKMS